MWQWGPRHDRRGEDKAKPIRRWQKHLLKEGDLRGLAKLLNRKPIGREWASPDMSEEFGAVRDEVAALYERRRGLPATRVQRALWQEGLAENGCAPGPEEAADEMFVLHTTFVVAARMISRAVVAGGGGGGRDDEEGAG